MHTVVLRKRPYGPAPAGPLVRCVAHREPPSDRDRRVPSRPDARSAGCPTEAFVTSWLAADIPGCPGFRANTKATRARGSGEDQHGCNTDKTAFPGIRRHS